MKRNLGLALVAIFVVGLTILLPTSLAKRNDNSVKHSNSGGQIIPELFRVNKQDQNRCCAYRHACGQFCRVDPRP